MRRIPRVLVQTAGHVAGVAYFYQPQDFAAVCTDRRIGWFNLLGYVYCSTELLWDCRLRIRLADCLLLFIRSYAPSFSLTRVGAVA